MGIVTAIAVVVAEGREAPVPLPWQRLSMRWERG
jgi:hypothetical protein